MDNKNFSLSIMEQLCFSTTRIEATDSNGKISVGTGFFFCFKIDENTSIPFVVTNKHMVNGMKTGQFMFTKADDSGNPINKEHIKIYIDQFEQQWFFHPDDDVDLCIMPVDKIHNIAQKQGEPLFYRTYDETLIPDSYKLNELDAVEDILMIGYPNGLWDSVNNKPIIRKGITATDVKFDYKGKKEFLIDAACFPGSSGSPVLLCNVGGYNDKNGSLILGGTRLFLLGILYAGPQLTVEGDIKVVTIPNVQHKALVVSQIPNNLGCVIKSSRILDFIPIIKQKFNL